MNTENSRARTKVAAGSLRVPDGVSISYSTQLPQHVTFAGSLAQMDELVAVLRATADEMEKKLETTRGATNSVTWQRNVPPTEAEIEQFCEEMQVVRPDPSDERAVNSFASRLVDWLSQRRSMWEPVNE